MKIQNIDISIIIIIIIIWKRSEWLKLFQDFLLFLVTHINRSAQTNISNQINFLFLFMWSSLFILFLNQYKFLTFLLWSFFVGDDAMLMMVYNTIEKIPIFLQTYENIVAVDYTFDEEGFWKQSKLFSHHFMSQWLYH